MAEPGSAPSDQFIVFENSINEMGLLGFLILVFFFRFTACAAGCLAKICWNKAHYFFQSGSRPGVGGAPAASSCFSSPRMSVSIRRRSLGTSTASSSDAIW